MSEVGKVGSPGLRFTVMSTRYNAATWAASERYRNKHNLSCIYSCSGRITESVLLGSMVYVVEMNNDTNQIIGIGLIKNRAADKRHKVQDDCNVYNRYVYVGICHMSREVINQYNPLLVYILEDILFKGKTHSKRGRGLTRVPECVMHAPVCEGVDIKHEIMQTFVRHFIANNDTNNTNNTTMKTE